MSETFDDIVDVTLVVAAAIELCGGAYFVGGSLNGSLCSAQPGMIAATAAPTPAMNIPTMGKISGPTHMRQPVTLAL